MPFEQESDLWRALIGEPLTLEDVKALFRDTGNREDDPERIAYANSLVPEAGDYLRAYELRALLRADISEAEATVHLSRNKTFFTRLAELLPSLLRFFALHENLAGLLYCIDQCHNDFHHTAASPRRDRQARQTKELLTAAREATAKAAAALENAKRLVEGQYAAYSAAYRTESRHETPRFEQLIEELIMCSGVLEISGATRAADWRDGKSGTVLKAQWRRECQSIHIERSRIFDLSIEQQPEKPPPRAAPSPRAAVAPTKKYRKTTPCKVAGGPPQPTVWTENLTRRANQRHNFTITKSAKRPRERNGLCLLWRQTSPACDRMLHRDSFHPREHLV
jgi:hypothetical protein